MFAQEYARRYTQAQVVSADRTQLLLRVMEGGATFLGRARDALAAGDAARFAENLRRAQAIIAELHGTLDHRAGGEIAANLSRLYEFMLLHLTEANFQRSVQHVDDVLRVYGIVVGAFRTVIERGASAAAGTAGSATGG
jgi:flagellar secretion chaperone FliS